MRGVRVAGCRYSCMCGAPPDPIVALRRHPIRLHAHGVLFHFGRGYHVRHSGLHRSRGLDVAVLWDASGAGGRRLPGHLSRGLVHRLPSHDHARGRFQRRGRNRTQVLVARGVRKHLLATVAPGKGGKFARARGVRAVRAHLRLEHRHHHHERDRGFCARRHADGPADHHLLRPLRNHWLHLQLDDDDEADLDRQSPNCRAEM